MSEPIRLARRVAEITGCTRAEAEAYVRNGWVTVDGVMVETPQTRIGEEVVALDPDARKKPVEPATLLFHKPAGFDAFNGIGSAAMGIGPDTHWADDPHEQRVLQRHFERLTPMVPLEPEASGLIVLTQDGRVARRLVEDAAQIEHEVLVTVDGRIAPYGLHKLASGMSAEGREIPPCKVSWQNETTLRFAIKGAQPGQLRAMCAEVSLDVTAIRRLRIGRIAIGKGPEGAMPPGQWRYLPVGERF
ncbi:MAG: rRNA pseudouridine synthase [Silanimonas sp.]